MLTNPEEIHEMDFDGHGCCVMRIQSPCPVCGKLSGYFPDWWEAADRKYYRGYFCDKHGPFDLSDTEFEMSSSHRMWLLTTMKQSGFVDRWRQGLHAEYTEDLGMPDGVAWRTVDDVLYDLDIINRGCPRH